MQKIDIGVNLSYFSDLSMTDAVRAAKKAGFLKIELDGCALRELNDNAVKNLFSVIDGEGMECASIDAAGRLMPVAYGNLAAGSKGERDRALDFVLRCVEWAEKLQAGTIVCDIGTTTEDGLSLREQNLLFNNSLERVLKAADACDKKVALMHVPGRRWIVWNQLPPDPARVVERYVPPWRLWPDAEKIVGELTARWKNKVLWVLDTANEIVGHGVEELRLETMARFYAQMGMGMVYLANHPGRYNRVWHRLLLHQPLWNGCFTARDYRALGSVLKEVKYNGPIMLKIREACPSRESLRKSRAVLKGRQS